MSATTGVAGPTPSAARSRSGEPTGAAIVQDGDRHRPIPRQQGLATGDGFRDGDELIVEAGVQPELGGMQMGDAADPMELLHDRREITRAGEMRMHEVDPLPAAEGGDAVDLIQR